MSDFPEWNPEADSPDYVYARMADHIQLRIESGELKPGARLPGEVELRAAYRVSLSTVRKATEKLRERGLVTTTPAKGTFIAAPKEG